MRVLLGLLLIAIVGCGDGSSPPGGGTVPTTEGSQANADESPAQAAAEQKTAPRNEQFLDSDVARIAAQPHQAIVDIPQLVSAVLKPGMWQRTGRIVVQPTPGQKARTIERKTSKKIKHVQGKYVVIETTDEKGSRVGTEIHSYDRVAKTMHSTFISAQGVVSRLIGVPDPIHHTIEWKSSNPKGDARQELTLTCAKDGLSAHLQGKIHQGGTLRSTFSGILERVGDLPESDLTPAK